MKLKEFEEKIKANPELKQKFMDAKKNIKDASKPACEVLSEIAAGLGFDVPASEFKLDEIKQGALNDEELQAVAGGMNFDDCRQAHVAADEGRCLYDYVDTDCIFHDACDGMVKMYSECDSWFWHVNG